MAPHGECSDYAGQYKAYLSTLSISTFWHDPDLESGDCVRGNRGEDGPVESRHESPPQKKRTSEVQEYLEMNKHLAGRISAHATRNTACPLNQASLRDLKLQKESRLSLSYFSLLNMDGETNGTSADIPIGQEV